MQTNQISVHLLMKGITRKKKNFKMNVGQKKFIFKFFKKALKDFAIFLKKEKRTKFPMRNQILCVYIYICTLF